MNPIKTYLLQDAPYLNTVRNKLLLIGILSVFTIFFLLVYDPFQSSSWDGNVYGYVIIGISVMVLSQFVFRKVFRKPDLRFYELICFGIGELLMIALMIQVFYGPEFPDLSGYLGEYLLTLKLVSLIIIGPYALSIWHLAVRHKISTMQERSAKDPEIITTKPNALLTLTGENNKILGVFNYDELLFVRSSGNYLEIHYLQENNRTKQLIRTSLKELEAKVSDPNFIRVHRSYMVNKNKISSVSKEKKGYKLSMQFSPEEMIPVSMGYKDQFEKALDLEVDYSSQNRAHS